MPNPSPTFMPVANGGKTESGSIPVELLAAIGLFGTPLTAPRLPHDL